MHGNSNAKGVQQCDQENKLTNPTPFPNITIIIIKKEKKNYGENETKWNNDQIFGVTTVFTFKILQLYDKYKK